MEIKLTFINQSTQGPDIVVCGMQPSVSTIAWTVIQHCAPGDSHPFDYPAASAIGYSDSFGNYTPQVPAMPGELFRAVRTMAGDTIALDGQGAAGQIALVNQLPDGAITVGIYKDARLFASRSGVSPQMTVSFAFEPRIWIGAVPEAVEGDVLNEAALSAIHTEISLLGIASADIVMTGGGKGGDAEPFQFTLTNVVTA